MDPWGQNGDSEDQNRCSDHIGSTLINHLIFVSQILRRHLRYCTHHGMDGDCLQI